MGSFVPNYKPVEKPVSIVGREACEDYRKWSVVRNPSNISYYTDYRRITRKIWKKVAEASINYESGVYAKDFFYIVPQVIANKPFIELANGRIKTNDVTGGDMYTPIFCNLFKKLNHFCWALDGGFLQEYKGKLKEIINKFVPKYYFILPILRKNNL